jgi:hypothetical protein
LRQPDDRLRRSSDLYAVARCMLSGGLRQPRNLVTAYHRRQASRTQARLRLELHVLTRGKESPHEHARPSVENSGYGESRYVLKTTFVATRLLIEGEAHVRCPFIVLTSQPYTGIRLLRLNRLIRRHEDSLKDIQNLGIKPLRTHAARQQATISISPTKNLQPGSSHNNIYNTSYPLKRT